MWRRCRNLAPKNIADSAAGPLHLPLVIFFKSNIFSTSGAGPVPSSKDMSTGSIMHRRISKWNRIIRNQMANFSFDHIKCKKHFFWLKVKDWQGRPTKCGLVSHIYTDAKFRVKRREKIPKVKIKQNLFDVGGTFSLWKIRLEGKRPVPSESKTHFWPKTIFHQKNFYLFPSLPLVNASSVYPNCTPIFLNLTSIVSF